MKRLLAILLGAAMMIGVMTGCGNTASAESGTESGVTHEDSTTAEKVLVGLSIRGLENPYYVELTNSVQALCDATPGTEMVIMEHNSDEQKQVNDIKSFIARGGKNCVLYVDPQSASINAEIAELCEEAGVYWTSTWTMAKDVYPIDYKYYVAHQSVDNVTGAYEAACAMFESFPNQTGKVTIMAGALANDASDERVEGFKQALAEYPNVELLDEQPCDWDTQISLNLTQTWLSKYGDELNGILCPNDSVALAAIEGLKAKGVSTDDVKITGFDGIPTGIESIQAGEMLATCYANGWCQGAYGVATAYNAYTGALDVESCDQTKRMYYTKGITVTGDNVEEFVAQYVDSKPDVDYTESFGGFFKVMEIN